MMIPKLPFRASQRCERGASIVECAMVLPFLVVLLMGVVDIGRAVSTYLALTQVAHEAVRFAAVQPNLEQGNYSSPVPVSAVAQANVESRVRILLQDQELDLSAADFQLHSEFKPLPNPADGGLPLAQDDTVAIQLQISFETLFPLFPSLPMTVRARGPYLFQRVAT